MWGVGGGVGGGQLWVLDNGTCHTPNRSNKFDHGHGETQ